VGTLDATGGRVVARHTWTAHASDRFFLGVSALAFAASAAATVLRCASMSSLGTTPMPGGWTMSMAWQRMPGETWSGAAASFLAMWVVMMVAMMLPSLVPTLWRYRRAVGIAGAPRLEWLTPAVTIGYFAIWAALGAAVFPLGAATAAIAMRLPALARGVPIARGVVVMVAGALQCTAWAARLVCWKASPHGAQPLMPDGRAAWRHGVCLGLSCAYGSAGLTAILLAVGVMDLRAMAVVTAAITIERLAPRGGRTARAIGAAAIALGIALIGQAL